jgi:RNA-directed DNA polymerase
MTTAEARIASAIGKAQNYGEEFAKDVAQHAQRHEELLKAHAGAVENRNVRKARQTEFRVYRSFSSRLVCLLRGLKKTNQWTLTKILAEAAKLDPYHDCGELIGVWAVLKASGNGFRPICSFGPRRRALQNLCGDVIEATSVDVPANFLRKGRGIESASSHISILIESGDKYFVEFDIKDFYRSVQTKNMAKALMMNQSVYDNCITISSNAPLHCVPSLSLAVSMLGEAARKGLPQGSRTSTLIAALLLGPYLEQFAPVDHSVIYGDDVLIGFGDEAEADALKKALPDRLKDHPFGPLHPKHCEVRLFEVGINFLSYKFKPGFGGKVRLRPSDNSFTRYENHVEMLAATYPTKAAEKKIAAYSSGWTASFPSWNFNETSEFYLWLTTMNATMRGTKIYFELHPLDA